MSEKGIRVEYDVHFRRDRRARKVVRRGPAPATTPEPVPRIARLLALAYRWEGMVRRGEVKDYTEIASVTGLTKGRVTQICSLTLLAPAIQEGVLDLTLRGDRFSGRVLRGLIRDTLWDDQRAEWRRRVP